jgi:hypothetical protein
MAGYRAKQSKFVPLSLLIVAAFGGIGSYATGADPLPYGSDTCIQGYVWRVAGPGDVVCVTPATRSQASSDNAAASRKAANALAPTPRGPRRPCAVYGLGSAF